MSRFTNQVVFLTGGTSGLGLATGELFLAEGAKIFVTDLEEHSVLSRLASKHADFQRCDVGNPDECAAAVEACIEKYGRIDVLFNCAAQVGTLNPVPQQEIKDFQKVINTNLCSVFYLSRLVIPQMQRQGKGVIVNVGSTSGIFADYGLCSYNAAKAGVLNLTRAMALDHAREGIRVNVVCPGYMVTPMTQAFKDNPTVYKALLEGIPQGRGCDPLEVARTVLFLASDEASYVNGATLVVDGAWTAHSGAPNFYKHLVAPQLNGGIETI